MNTTILIGDCRQVLESLPSESVQTCVTSPPYFGLRDYGTDNQIGLEASPIEFVAQLVAVFREVRRVLKNDGTLWLNLGDSYAAQGGAHGDRDDNQTGVGAKRLHIEGSGDKAARRPPYGVKPKDLIGIPWRVAFALQADGWYLRQDIIWHKPNPMPESVTDRCTKAHEYIFLLSKSERYFFDAKAIAEPLAEASIKRGPVKLGGTKGENYCPEKTDPNFRNGKEQWGREMDFSAGGTRNKRSVWTIPTKPFRGAHFATFPPDLITPCILAGSKTGDMVLDPFGGAGTTGLAANRLGRHATLIELNPAYAELAQQRISGDSPLFANTGNI